MTDIVLSPITSGYNLGKINANFDKVEDVINDEVIHNIGGNNIMHQDLDMNGNALLNVYVDQGNPGSLVTIAAGDVRWYNVLGDSLEGPMNVADNQITGVRDGVLPTEAVNKGQLDGEATARANGDASLQDQINGTTPPIGTAFSIVSWHDQFVTNSITIPDNKNAWSFGPTLTIAVGQIITIGTNSFWTIANGATTGNGTLNPEIPDPLDMGVLP
ncbi:Phage protein [Pseudomonas phage GP100]|nr:Phage protein [Pseudomonas phage GP100]